MISKFQPISNNKFPACSGCNWNILCLSIGLMNPVSISSRRWTNPRATAQRDSSNTACASSQNIYPNYQQPNTTRHIFSKRYVHFFLYKTRHGVIRRSTAQRCYLEWFKGLINSTRVRAVSSSNNYIMLPRRPINNLFVSDTTKRLYLYHKS